MKKKDLILIGIILAVILISFLIITLVKQDGAYVIVRVDGVQVAKYALSADGQYDLNGGTNVLRIEDGKAPSAVVDKTTESIFKAMYGYDASGAETVVKASAYTGITYLAGAEIYNIPADKTVTYIVCPYTVSGDTVTYGIACTVTFPAAD
jgi:hypothetical protein